jgi:hypothetical protein
MPDIRTDVRYSRHWDQENESEFPDSRLTGMARDRTSVYVGRMECARVFCANCGKPSGASLPATPFIFFLCDNCAAIGGTPPGCVQIAD